MKSYDNIFKKIIGVENLFRAWGTFEAGKQKRKEVMEFRFRLEEQIFGLHRELTSRKYTPGKYEAFYVCDPKIRLIHKAPLRDRIVHHAIYNVIAPIFEETFIEDSFSCRIGKGTHKGVQRLQEILRKISRNNTRTCYALKCDIKKYFASINHKVLQRLIQERIHDEDAVRLLTLVIEGFTPGLPIGNLTSQLFANIYLNELDQFVKHMLRIPYYIRYTDDFVILGASMTQLEEWKREIKIFLETKLYLTLHPNKVTIRKHHQGVDFLGYIQFPHHRLLRTTTKQRILRKVDQGISERALQSYLGVLSHANAYELSNEIVMRYLNNKKPQSDAAQQPYDRPFDFN